MNLVSLIALDGAFGVLKLYNNNTRTRESDKQIEMVFERQGSLIF